MDQSRKSLRWVGNMKRLYIQTPPFQPRINKKERQSNNAVGRSYCDYVLVMSNVYHKRAKSTRRLAIVRCLYAMVRENTMASPSCDGKRGGDTTSIHWSARRPPHRPMETLIDTILVYGASPAQFVRCLSLFLHHQTASSVNPNSVTMLVNSHSQ